MSGGIYWGLCAAPCPLCFCPVPGAKCLFCLSPVRAALIGPGVGGPAGGSALAADIVGDLVKQDGEGVAADTAATAPGLSPISPCREKPIAPSWCTRLCVVSSSLLFT